MRLQVLTPFGVVADENVLHLRFEAADGSFSFLPHHADFVSVVVPGIVSYTPDDEEREIFMACDGGILVKANQKVLLSVRRAVKGENLAELAKTIEVEFKKVEGNRKSVNAAMARLEAGLTRGVMTVKRQADVMAVR